MDTEWLNSIPKDFTQRMPWQYLESTINKPADLYNKNSYDKLNEYDNGLFEHNLYNSKGIASADPNFGFNFTHCTRYTRQNSVSLCV